MSLRITGVFRVESDCDLANWIWYWNTDSNRTPIKASWSLRMSLNNFCSACVIGNSSVCFFLYFKLSSSYSMSGCFIPYIKRVTDVFHANNVLVNITSFWFKAKRSGSRYLLTSNISRLSLIEWFWTYPVSSSVSARLSSILRVIAEKWLEASPCI